MSENESSRRPDAGASQSDDSAETADAVDSGQSEDIENSLTAQGVSDRMTTDDGA